MGPNASNGAVSTDWVGALVVGARLHQASGQRPGDEFGEPGDGEESEEVRTPSDPRWVTRAERLPF